MSGCEHKNALMTPDQMDRNMYRGPDDPLEVVCRDCGAQLRLYGEITPISIHHDCGPDVEVTEFVVEKVE